ncbi:metallophosphoesterase [Sphingobacteriaceae bacterium]|nr:metallophosphoesterase [Sphingobacteriaceae bacterium]
MQVLVLSDIHGNLPALEFVLKQEPKVDLVISLGDVVNYGPWSNECVDLLESLDNKMLLKGNHEEAYLSGTYPGTNEVAKSFFNFCYPGFERKAQIAAYAESFTLHNFDCVHTLNNSYVFPDTEIEIHKNYFIGHSHKQFLREINGYTLVNAGSVGQNRTNADLLNYVVWNTESGKIDLITKEFSADQLLSEMRQRNYPEICISYIQSKRKEINGR